VVRVFLGQPHSDGPPGFLNSPLRKSRFSAHGHDGDAPVANGQAQINSDQAVVRSRKPINAFLLTERLPNAQLIMYPYASHGAQSQHAEVFLEHARLFLSGS